MTVGLAGGPGNDRMFGGAGDDTILGDELIAAQPNVGGSDHLFGGPGDDQLDGEGYALHKASPGDVLSGGDGTDVALFDLVSLAGTAALFQRQANHGQRELMGNSGNLGSLAPRALC